MTTVLIFAGKHRPLIRALTELVGSSQLIVFDEQDVKLGTDLLEQMQLHLKRAARVIALISFEFVCSDVCMLELKTALDSGRTVIPIFTDIAPELVYLYREPLPKLRYLRGIDLSTLGALSVPEGLAHRKHFRLPSARL